MTRSRHDFLDSPAPIPFVHRGGPVDRPENTLAAFDRAYTMGFRYFETDVHATSDGVLVAFHDKSLKRMTGERVPIGSLPAAEVARLRVEGEPIPLLDELLTTFPSARINIDPKADSAVRPLVRLLHERKAISRVCLASFSDRRLRWLRTALGERACTAAGPREIARARWAALRGRPLPGSGFDVLQVPMGPVRFPLVNRALIDTAHAQGVPVHVWTVNQPTAMHWMLDLGVDGIMSDDVHLLRDVFEARQIWQPDST